jgi:hypothetical protein
MAVRHGVLATGSRDSPKPGVRLADVHLLIQLSLSKSSDFRKCPSPESFSGFHIPTRRLCEKGKCCERTQEGDTEQRLSTNASLRIEATGQPKKPARASESSVSEPHTGNPTEGSTV